MPGQYPAAPVPSFTVSGTVVHGKHLGSTIGFPTANLSYDPDSCTWPKEGVYVGIARLEGETKAYLSILNQGKHPTTPEGQPSVEAHLLGWMDHSFYGRHLTLEYYDFLRPEITFPSLDALKEQLSRDKVSAIEWARQHAPHLLDFL